MRSQVERPADRPGPGPVQVDDGRPVPQVDPVGDRADQVQRPPGQGAGNPGSTSRASATTSAASTAQSRNPPWNMKLVGRPPGRAGGDPEHARTTAAAGATTVQRGAPAARAGGAPRPARPGRARPGDRRAGCRCRSRPARDRSGVEQDGHGDRRTARRATTVRATPMRRQPRRPAEQEQEHERPHQVELLLDRQRPRVLQGRGRRELGEVRLVGEDGVPVVDVEQGRRSRRRAGRRGRSARWRRAAEPRVDDEVERQRDHDEEQRRQQAPGPPPPEGGQADAARSAPLLEQQGRDRKPDSTKNRSTPR